MNYECLEVAYLKVDMLLISSILTSGKLSMTPKELFLHLRST